MIGILLRLGLKMKNDYKYAEDKIVSDFKAYLDKTYQEHYKTDEQNVECFCAKLFSFSIA